VAGVGNILIKVGADAGQAVRELSTVDKALGSTQTTSEKMGAGLKKAALPAAAALGAIGVAALGAAKAAAADQAAQEHLAGVMERTAGATAATIKQTEDWISATSRATGVADDELRPAMETLVTATGDVGKAQKEMGAALDIAAASGKSVEDVSKAIALAHTGQTAKLEKLIPGLSKAAKESDNMAQIMGELSEKTKGAAAESAGTAAGQFKIFQVQVGELQESLGAALLPVITALAPVLLQLADLAGKNTKVIEILVVTVAALAAGVLIANAAMKLYAAAQLAVTAAQKVAAGAAKAYTIAQWALNVAMEANPIGLVVIALAALAAGIYLAYTRSETFRRIVGAAMDAVAGAVGDVKGAFDQLLNAASRAWNWIADHWKLALFAFGPIGAAVYLIATNFDKIKSAAQAAHDAIWTVIRAIERLIDKLPDIHFPKIPHLPGLNLAAVGPAPAVALSSSGPVAGHRARAAPGTGAITVNVYGAVDPEGTARAIRRVLERHDRRQGRTV
jgi:hypothetical protein